MSDEKCSQCGAKQISCDEKGWREYECGSTACGPDVACLEPMMKYRHNRCLTAENTQLRADNERLEADVDKWKQYATLLGYQIMDEMDEDNVWDESRRGESMALDMAHDGPRQAAEAAAKEDGEKPGIQEALDKVREAGGKAWDGVDVEVAIAELRGYGAAKPQGRTPEIPVTVAMTDADYRKKLKRDAAKPQGQGDKSDG